MGRYKNEMFEKYVEYQSGRWAARVVLEGLIIFFGTLSISIIVAIHMATTLHLNAVAFIILLIMIVGFSVYLSSYAFLYWQYRRAYKTLIGSNMPKRRAKFLARKIWLD